MTLHPATTTSGIALTEDGEALLPAIREYLSANGKAGESDRGHLEKADGDDPHCRVCERRDALDAGDPLPLPAGVPGHGCRPAHGGP